jgi:hypothetical protein
MPGGGAVAHREHFYKNLCHCHRPGRHIEKTSFASIGRFVLLFAGTIVFAACCTFSNQGGLTMVTETRETGSLIGSDKVEGTAVYGANDTKIGSIERVMIDKMSGKVSYAVLSFGGFLGIGDDHYPLPWQSLKYDTNLGGYRTGITETQLKGAPKYGNDNAWNWSDPAKTRSVNDYYGVAI